MKRLAIFLTIFIALLAGSYWWLFMESHVPSGPDYTIDMTEVRRLAGSIPGDKVRDIHVETVGHFAFPRTGVVAGDSWESVDIPVMSYQLRFPDSAIIVDTALDSHAGHLVSFDPEAYDRMNAAMDSASAIYVTHEHPDHIGGLTVHPRLSELLDKAKITQEQVDHPERMGQYHWPAGALKDYSPLVYEKYAAIAPGVVLIKAPGHTPGSQMFFVQRADGKELLFIGDVAWTLRNVETVRGRPHLMSWLFIGEDAGQVMHELVELHRLHEAEPSITIVPGHDITVRDALLKQGLFVERFN